MASKNSAEILKRLNALIKMTKGFDTAIKTINITKAVDGFVVAEMKVLPEQANQIGTLHGGCTATIVDNITTYALLEKEGVAGVTVNLNVDYLKGAPVGEDIIIEAKLVRAGKSLAFLNCLLKFKKDNSIIASGSHIKYMKR